MFLKEKNIYSWCIVIFKSYEKNQYSSKSYDIFLQNSKKEEYHEIYSVERIKKEVDILK